MEQSSQSLDEILQGKPTIPKILKFVLPTVITCVFASLYGIVDGIFISKVGGNTAFAAVNLVTPLFLIFSSFGMMFGTGGNAIVSKIRGEGDDEKARRVFSTLTISVLVLSVILTVLLWFFIDDILILLGATEDMLPLCLAYSRIIIPFIVCYLFQYYFQSMLVTAGKGLMGFCMISIAGVLNIVGDAVLVGVLAKTPEQTMRGAAIATAAGLIVGGAIPFFYFLFKNSSCLRIVKPEKSFKVVLETCSNGVSEFLSNISGAIMNTVFNGLLLYIIGEMGVSAYGSIGYINTIFLAIFMGYSVGISPIISYKYGAGDKTGLQQVYRKSMLIIAVSSVVMVILAEALAHPISAMFSAGNAELLKMTVVGFGIYAISFLFKGFNTFASAFFTALNNGFVSGLLAVCRAFLFSIGAVLILPLVFYYTYGADTALLGIWWSVNYAEFFALVMALIFLVAKKKQYQY